ncbi:MAG: glycosyltransferase [Myxococcales bacterium]|nr:glycosyltransferase [Myxococcales bacterium]
MRAFHETSVGERTIEIARAVVDSVGRAPGRGVVHLVPSVGWGGAERLACTLHRLAQERGWRSTFEAPAIDTIEAGAWEDGAIERCASRASAPETDRARSSVLRAWAYETRARVAALAPSVVHAHLAFPDRFGAALVASAGRPMIATFQLLPQRDRHFSRDEVFGFRSDTLLERVGHFLSRVTFVAPSEEDVGRLRVILPRSAKVVRVANCPPLARVRERAPSGEFCWPEGRTRVLSVGRLVEQKGFDRLIDALASGAVRERAWHLLIAGDGPEHARLQERARARGLEARVTIDRERRAAALYGGADLVVCPSRSEGYPLVPMEAIEAGRAVVASSIGAHRELFSTCDSALLPEDEGAWPEVLATLLESEHARRALFEREQRALPKDPRAETSSAYERLYREAAHGDRW